MQIKVWETAFEGDQVIVLEVMNKDTTSGALMDLAILLHRFYQKVNF